MTTPTPAPDPTAPGPAAPARQHGPARVRRNRVSALARHLIGFGVEGVSVENGDYGRTYVGIAGWDTSTVTSVARLLNRDGRRYYRDTLDFRTGGRKVIFDIPPSTSEPIDDVVVHMSLATFINLVNRKDA
jgi:hypothetical protein